MSFFSKFIFVAVSFLLWQQEALRLRFSQLNLKICLRHRSLQENSTIPLSIMMVQSAIFGRIYLRIFLRIHPWLFYTVRK